MYLLPELKNDLHWLVKNIKELNGHEMVEGEESFVLDVAFALDASGVGGYLGGRKLPRGSHSQHYSSVCSFH